MHYKNKEPKVDLWRMDLNRLTDIVGRPPVEVRVENKHVVAVFPGLNAVTPEGHTVLGTATTIKFRKW